MLTLRKSSERGHANHGWLDSFHTFSFSSYYDPKHMGFGVLRVINEDRIKGGTGFNTHPHRDMEIVTYVIDGALAHKDSMGNTTVIKPGEVQRMSAGTGIEHSEFNHLPDKDTHLLQIWLLTEKQGLTPSYDQKSFTEALRRNNFILALSRNGRGGAVTIHQDVEMYIGKFSASDELTFDIRPQRKAWVQMIKGELDVNGQSLDAGDGLAISDEPRLALRAEKASEFLLFDLP